MKLNFWQWLGIILLLIGLAWLISDWSHPKAATHPGSAMPTTQTAPVP